MLGSILDQGALRAARTALTGLSRRHEAISANIANIDTPGYQRKAVDFEGALAASLQRAGGRAPLARTDARHLTPGGDAAVAPGTARPRDIVASRSDANSVSIDEEMSALAETQLRYQALTQTVGRRLGVLRTAIRG
jgi:flagellar basal-body rod protein FlgB